jgi:hypothetical protein
MMHVCICELSFFDYVIRIGNLSVLVYFLLYFIENKFLIWLRKEEEWTVIDRQMLDTLFDNNEKSEVEEVPELEQEIVAEEASEEASEAVVEEEAEGSASDASSEAVVEAEVTVEASSEAVMEEQEASKILNETEIIDALMK